MTFPRLRQLAEFWRRHPPAQLLTGELLAGLAGFSLGSASENKPAYGGLADLIGCVRGAGGQITRH